MHTIAECRKYGINNSQLQMLKEDFYIRKGTSKYSTAVDTMLLYVLAKIKITLMINNEGTSYFVDMGNYTFVDSFSNSYLYINFNNIVDKVWNLAFKNKKDLTDYEDWSDIYISYILSNKLTIQEDEILTILKDKKYKQITIKKGKDSYTVYGETNNSEDGISETELIEKMKDKEFTNIEIVKRDGKIVSYKSKDVYKI